MAHLDPFNQAINNTDYGFGKRADNSNKGLGYFGMINRPDNKVSSELSVGVNVDGKDMEVPALVPTLTQEEINYLIQGNQPTPEIITKAVEHAKKRIGEGKNPFAQPGEQQLLPLNQQLNMVNNIQDESLLEQELKRQLGIGGSR